MHHDPKPRPNLEIENEILRRMTPERKLLKAFELTEFVRELRVAGIAAGHPGCSAEEARRLAIAERIRWLSETC